MAQSRRSFLTMLGFAPLAAPAIAAAAPAAVETAKGEWGARFVEGSLSRARGASRILIADEVDHWPDAMRSRRHHEAVAADTHHGAVPHLAAGLVPISSACPVFIDDVGGGP